MNRRQKIIVSITGIFLVLLILVGLTYAYFLTRIQGNTNPKSISVTTADLKLVYGDGTATLVTKDNIIPGDTVGTKDFTVTNEGDSETEYVVVLDNIKITEKDGGTTTTFNSNDFVYELTCSGKITNDSGETTSECNGVSEETTLPLTDDGILIENKIAVDEVQTYNLTVKYKETGLDQSEDMGKKLEAKVDIKNFRDINPYEEGTLAYNIINNAKNNINGTELKTTPETKPLEEISTENERELSITTDDYGTSYYYRGNVEDNYVQFANMCWRIVRIQGDGSVKLVLASEKECSNTNVTSSSGYATDGGRGEVGEPIWAHYGYKDASGFSVNDYIHSAADSTGGARNELNNWLTTKITGTEQSKLKEESWCIGDLKNAYDFDGAGSVVGTVTEKINNFESFYYTAGNRYDYLKTPKLKCETTGTDGEIDKNKIGMLTMDEVAFAGGGKSVSKNYYLYKNATDGTYLTLSPSYFQYETYEYVFIVLETSLDSGFCDPTMVMELRPVVTLNDNITISSGNGTLEKPYVIAD